VFYHFSHDSSPYKEFLKKIKVKLGTKISKIHDWIVEGRRQKIVP
jgi:hypothetical protein